MPTDIPGPLPSWAATLVRLTGGAGHSYLFDLLSYFNEVPDPSNLAWMHVQCHADCLASSDTADDATIGFDIANITGGSLDTSWTTADMTTCETALTTFLNACVGQMHNSYKWDQYRWYLKRFNPYTEAKPYQDSGPPVRITPLNITSVLTSYTTPQTAISVTERTAWPHHWGRFYIPGIAGNLLTSTLQMSNTTTQALANAYQSLNTTLTAAGFFLVVPTTQVNKEPNRGLLQVTSVQVDSLQDVIRSRRLRTPTTRTVRP